MMQLTYLPEIEKIHIKCDERYEYLAIKKLFARRPDGFMFQPRFKLKLWDGYNHGFEVETDTIPFGMWREVMNMCNEFGYVFNFTNKDEFPLNRSVKKSDATEWMSEFIKNNKYLQSMKMDEREYQLKVAASVLKDRYCNVSVATSGGKTFIYSLIVFYLLAHKHKKKKFLLVVPSKTLVTQFYDDLLKYNDGQFDINIQEIFDDGENPRTTDPDKEPNIVIGTFQSLAGYHTKPDPKNPKKRIKLKPKYPKEWFQQFFSVTVDEGHKSGAESYRKILRRTFCNAYYRWGMSGTFPKDDTEEMMQIMKHTGPVIEVVKAKFLMDKGYITKVKIKGIKMYHNDFEFADQLEIVASRDRKSCYDLECEKIQESEARLMIINKIVKECKANTLVLFHNTDYGKRIFELLKEENPNKDFYYIDGSIKNNATKKNIENNRNYIKSEMNKTDGRVKVLVASFGTLSTGVSIDAITNVIFTQSFKKAQVIIQSIGRALRLHKEKMMAYIFDLVDIFNQDPDIVYKKGKYKFKNILYGHWEERLHIYAEEEYPTTEMEINL